MLRFGCCVFLLLIAGLARAEVILFSIYSIPLFWGNEELVVTGKRTYEHDDISVARGPAPNVSNWTKTLDIANGFELGTSVYQEPRTDGFGLWIRKNGEGFSWEWFDRENGDVFRKLQGPGRLKVRFRHSGGLEEIAELEFLDDVTMRLNRFWLIPFFHKDTDRLVIKKGSILWLAP